VTAKEPLPPAGIGGARFTLSNGQAIELPPHDEFYAQLVARNRGLISDAEQERLRRATLLVAGCGSIGGAVIEPLVRMGAEHLVLAEPDGYDLHNMNRQSVRLQDLGRNKAEVFQERLRDVNPYASIRVDPRGICDENVEALVREATLIIDGVDVTTKAPLRLKFALHQWAKQLGVPVVSGYDIADLQLVPIYDYRRPSTAVLHGRVGAEEIKRLEPIEFLRRVVPRPSPTR
jgi:tRNA A37 threonylcarbamoyladenosine dehydratase